MASRSDESTVTASCSVSGTKSTEVSPSNKDEELLSELEWLRHRLQTVTSEDASNLCTGLRLEQVEDEDNFEMQTHQQQPQHPWSHLDDLGHWIHPEEKVHQFETLTLTWCHTLRHQQDTSLVHTHTPQMNETISQCVAIWDDAVLDWKNDACVTYSFDEVF